MSKVRIPSFLSRLDQAEKQKQMSKYRLWKDNELTKYLLQNLEDELDKLVLEDEKSSFLSYFQTRWHMSKRMGKREAIRQIIKDLK